MEAKSVEVAEMEVEDNGKQCLFAIKIMHRANYFHTTRLFTVLSQCLQNNSLHLKRVFT